MVNVFPLIHWNVNILIFFIRTFKIIELESHQQSI